MISVSCSFDYSYGFISLLKDFDFWILWHESDFFENGDTEALFLLLSPGDFFVYGSLALNLSGGWWLCPRCEPGLDWNFSVVCDALLTIFFFISSNLCSTNFSTICWNSFSILKSRNLSSSTTLYSTTWSFNLIYAFTLVSTISSFLFFNSVILSWTFCSTIALNSHILILTSISLLSALKSQVFDSRSCFDIV